MRMVAKETASEMFSVPLRFRILILFQVSFADMSLAASVSHFRVSNLAFPSPGVGHGTSSRLA